MIPQTHHFKQTVNNFFLPFSLKCKFITGTHSRLRVFCQVTKLNTENHSFCCRWTVEWLHSIHPFQLIYAKSLTTTQRGEKHERQSSSLCYLTLNERWLEPITTKAKQQKGVHCTENPICVFPEMKLCGLVPNSYIHVICERFTYSQDRFAYLAAREGSNEELLALVEKHAGHTPQKPLSSH